MCKIWEGKKEKFHFCNDQYRPKINEIVPKYTHAHLHYFKKLHRTFLTWHKTPWNTSPTHADPCMNAEHEEDTLESSKLTACKSLYLLAAVESLTFFPSNEAKCCSRASRRLLGAWRNGNITLSYMPGHSHRPQNKYAHTTYSTGDPSFGGRFNNMKSWLTKRIQNDHVMKTPKDLTMNNIPLDFESFSCCTLSGCLQI